MKYLFIINPKSGKGRKEEIIRQLSSFFSGRNNAEIKINVTKKPGDAIDFARRSEADVVVACGGDGTVNEVVNGIMGKKDKRNKYPERKRKRDRKKPALAILPLGTSNMLAGTLGIPKNNIYNALNILLRNRRIFFDVGKANKRYFVIGAGIGIDAHMYKNAEPKVKKIFGEFAYPLSFLKTIFHYKPTRLKIKVKNDTYYGYYVLAANSTKYNKLLRLIPRSNPYDGYLDVLIFKKKNIFDQIRYMLSIAAKRPHKENDVVYFRAKKIKVISKKPAIAHADAEIIGETPVNIKLLHDALEVLH